MVTKFVSERNLQFLLYEVFNIERLTQYEYYREHNKKTFDMILKEGIRMAKGLLHPVYEEMDRNQPQLENGVVKVHPSVRQILKAYAEGGWLSCMASFEHDGEQLPHMIDSASNFIFAAANFSANVYPSLIVGASHLIESFGSKELYDTYVPRMRSGEWQGTMALTEPEAGSSLTDLASSATPTDKGYYLIQGQKIFISAGDHDGADNVVHLMLARIEGAPAGVKGISMFVVPKMRIDEGDVLVPNDIICSGIYHKLGYRGCPITQLSFGDRNDCRGWLVGEAHNGLGYMFQMMNESRIGVGLGAAALASAAYYASLDYAKSRHQGRKILEKDPTTPPVAIIEHADIKRMLLFQRSVVEGSLSLLIQTSLYLDMKKVVPPEQREKYDLLLEILTPVVKNYPSEMGIHSISQGLQCLGGAGYCDDYSLEQYFRDSRIHPIHEGTTGIQGIDLLGRKIVMKNSRAFHLFIAEVKKTISEAEGVSGLTIYAEQLNEALNRLQKVTQHLLEVAISKGAEIYLSDATLYLEYFGIITIAWQWLAQGIVISDALSRNPKSKDLNFYNGKMVTCKYFFAYELPRTMGLEKRLLDYDPITVNMTTEFFDD